MRTLYQFGNSVCSQKVRVTLIEKGLEWKTKNVNLFKSEQYDLAYLKINPKGVVPSLVDDGVPVIESSLICEYLDDRYPDPPLVPEDPAARARMRLWSKAVDEGLHEGVTELSFSAMFREKMKAMSDEEREIRFRNVGDPKRRDRFTSTYELGVESPYVFRAIAAYEKAFDNMEKELAAGGDWLIGGTYSLADINLMPYAARLNYLTLLDVWIAERPGVRAWWTRVQALPSFIAAIQSPLDAQEVADMAEYGSRIKKRVGELRADFLASA